VTNEAELLAKFLGNIALASAGFFAGWVWRGVEAVKRERALRIELVDQQTEELKRMMKTRSDLSSLQEKTAKLLGLVNQLRVTEKGASDEHSKPVEEE
jgi:hypothetical protein